MGVIHAYNQHGFTKTKKTNKKFLFPEKLGLFCLKMSKKFDYLF